MKNYLLGALLSLGFLVSPALIRQAEAATLSPSQISSIIGLLQAFGADQSVVTKVQDNLTSQASLTASVAGSLSGSLPHQFSVSPQTTVLNFIQRGAVGRVWPDSPLGVVKTGSPYTFFGGGSIDGRTSYIFKTEGTLNSPAEQSVSLSAISNKKSNYDYYSGGPVYRDPSSGRLLMIVHAERWPKGNQVYFTSSLGMAKSDDNGMTWSDLGEIVSVNRKYDPNDTTVANEIGSGGFVVQPDGNMYVYFRDVFADGRYNDIAVARAPLAQVLSSATQGQAALWKKYYCGQTCGFTQPGLGGLSSSLKNSNFLYPTVTYNEYLGKYLMAVVQPPKGEIYLLESSDGITWGDPTVIPLQGGVAYQPTFVGLESDPLRTGRRFYVYYVFGDTYATLTSTMTLARKLVCLGESSCTDTPIPQAVSLSQASKDFSSTQGIKQWSYRDSTGANMTFDTLNNRWKGADPFTLIFSNGSHPGMVTDSVRRWTASRSGTARITGTVSDLDTSCGDGVVASVRKGEATLWTGTIPNGGTPRTYVLSTDVQSGDTLDFVVNKGAGNNSCDSTTFDSVIEVFPRETDVFQASKNFSSTQGTKQWSYRDSSGESMTFDIANNRWKSSEAVTLLFPWGGHPGMTKDAVRRWTSPYNGTVRITGTVSDADTGGGDGVVVSIQKGAVTLWTQTIPNAGAIREYSLSATVLSGDTLDFVINKGAGNNSFDSTTFDPVIELLPREAVLFQASKDFSSTQGTKQWSYRDSTGANMTFDTLNNRWTGTDSFTLVFSNGSHPGMTTDAVRRWTAPYAGTAQISGTASDLDTACGDGVVVSIQKGSETLWTRTLTNGGTPSTYALSTSVQSGDTLDFVVNKGAGNNSCDSTTFDPIIELQ